jgi:hypothetical protein
VFHNTLVGVFGESGSLAWIIVHARSSIKHFMILSSLPMIVGLLHKTCTYRVGEHFHQSKVYTSAEGVYGTLLIKRKQLIIQVLPNLCKVIGNLSKMSVAMKYMVD